MAEQAAKTVVIIGAGISGLSAATNLIKHGGFNVIVLEAANRIGGRVHSTKFGSEIVEAGAQWVHGETGNKVFEIANTHGLLNTAKGNRKYGANAFYVTSNGEFLDDSMFEKMEKLMNHLLDLSPDEGEENEISASSSLGQIATEAFWKFNEKLPLHDDNEVCEGILDWAHRFQNNIDGADSWNDTSFFGQSQYKTCAGNPTISWKKNVSYFSFLDVLLNSCNESDDSSTTEENNSYSTDNLPAWIKLEKIVMKIQYDCNGSASVICKDGTDYSCDYLICTLPLGVLKEHHNILFKPHLPEEKIKAIEHIGFGTVDKIYLKFESPWWPADSDGFSLIWDTGERSNWTPNASDEVLGKLDENTGLPIWTRSLLGFYAVPSQPKMLCSWITGPPARYMERMDTEELKLVLINVLNKFVGGIFRVTEPTHILRTTWYENPFSRGSYSFRQMSSELNNVWANQLAEPIYHNNKPVICFAGEATHPSFYSTVHGGYESGIREAERIITDAKGKPWFSFCPFLA